MDRSFSLPALCAAALLVTASPSVAADAVVDAQADTILLRPLTLLKVDDLDFGTLLPSAAAGTAILNPVTGAVTTAGGVTAVSGATTPAAFVGAGTRRAPVIIRIPRDPIILTRVSGTETMTVSNWTLDGRTTRIIDANEAFRFQIGGQLDVGANQVDGTYVGTFSVTVEYH